MLKRVGQGKGEGDGEDNSISIVLIVWNGAPKDREDSWTV